MKRFGVKNESYGTLLFRSNSPSKSDGNIGYGTAHLQQVYQELEAEVS